MTATHSIQLPSAWRCTRFLLLVVAALITLSLAGQYFKYGLGHPKMKGFVPLFYLDLESNVPTWYSSAALGLASGLLVLIAAIKSNQRAPFWRHWGALAALFLLLSLDEIAMLHEYPIDPLRETFDAGGLLYYTWVVPGLGFVAAVGLTFRRFLQELPARMRWQLVAAAAVFCCGALGIEMLSGLQADQFGEETWAYAGIITLEEACEMLGVVIFIHALLEYLERTTPNLRLHFATARDSSAGDA